MASICSFNNSKPETFGVQVCFGLQEACELERLSFASPCQLTILLQTKTDLDAKSLGLAIFKDQFLKLHSAM